MLYERSAGRVAGGLTHRCKLARLWRLYPAIRGGGGPRSAL